MKDETTAIIAEASVIASDALNAQREAEARNAAKRQADRQAKMDAWQDPEAMAYRKAVHEKGAIESLWSLREAGECAPDRDIPIPPDSELPPHMRGQQPSTVRAFLRGSSTWNKKIKERAKADKQKNALRKVRPELFGIDFIKLRRETPITFGDEHKVRTGKGLTLKEPDHNAVPKAKAVEASKTPVSGVVARWLAGIKDAFEEL